MQPHLGLALHTRKMYISYLLSKHVNALAIILGGIIADRVLGRKLTAMLGIIFAFAHLISNKKIERILRSDS